jgi:pantetheine-phosphate adenylyltransferase
VCVGGAFNHLHKGHRKLLDRAFAAGDEVFIGLCSDAFAKKSRQDVRPYRERKQNIIQYLEERGSFHIIEIDNEFGIADTGNFDTIVVSKDTEATARRLNDVRKENGLKPLRVIVVDMVLAKDGKAISATRVMQGEIDEDGDAIK